MPFRRPKSLYKRRRSYAKKRTYKRRASVRRVPVAVKKFVSRALSKNTEDKSYQSYNLQQDIYPSNSTQFDSVVTPLAPDAVGLTLSQGAGQGQRIGNRIKIKKLTIAGVMHPTPYNATTNPTPAPIQIKMWIFYDKENPTLTPTPRADGDFLQFGNGVSGFQNDLMDLYAPVNKDRYSILWTGITKLGYASYTGTGALPQSGNLSNNDFQLNSNFAIDLTKMVPKYYDFRDTATNPTTRGLYMMCQAVYANGAQMASATIPAQMSYVQNVVFEDA